MSLANWQGFGEDLVGLAVERGAGCLYLHQAWKRVPKAASADESAAADADACMDTSDDKVRKQAHPYCNRPRGRPNRSAASMAMMIAVLEVVLR